MTSHLTIAVPTHNRSRLLRQTLDSIEAQTVPETFTVECLIVDNASTDDTAQVVQAFRAGAGINTRYVFERRPGSSFARNRAFQEARGDFILFIDDDAVAQPDWAARMVAAIEARALDVACGAVLPRWGCPPPRWLGPSVAIKLAVHDESAFSITPAARLDSIHNYFSANVGFRREAFNRFGGFREDLGVVGSNPMSGEDTELFERIMRGGGRMGFVPEARVYHLIPPERMTRAYLRRKAFAFGMGSAVAGGRSHNGLDKLVRNLLRMGLAAARRDRERMVYHELECANFFGYWRARLHPARASHERS
ncbi:MAG TPA: glycosyltransferase [Candidatus Binataceae bacterium]|nr:glycosyltransferase [Candidatus Binataceae bacterium]